MLSSRSELSSDLLVGVGGPGLPLLKLVHIDVEVLPPVIRGELVGLGGEPDRFGLRRAPLFAEAAEHAPLDVDVEAIQQLLFLLRLRVHLLVPVDIDDVDRAVTGADGAFDAPVLVQPEHAAEAVRGLPALLRILHRDLLLEHVLEGDSEPREEVQKHDLVGEPLERAQWKPPETQSLMRPVKKMFSKASGIIHFQPRSMS